MMSNQITVKFRSLLKSRQIDKFEIQGILTNLILSKTFFVKNSDLEPFLKEMVGISFKSYVMKSRTMILARTLREVEKLDYSDVQMLRQLLLKWVENADDRYSADSSVRKNNDVLDKWI